MVYQSFDAVLMCCRLFGLGFVMVSKGLEDCLKLVRTQGHVLEEDPWRMVPDNVPRRMEGPSVGFAC